MEFDFQKRVEVFGNAAGLYQCRFEWDMKGKYDAQIAALADRLAVAEERQKNGTDRAQLKQSLCKKLTAILSGEQESEVLYKTILDQITVFKDRHMELTLAGLPQVYVFS